MNSAGTDEKRPERVDFMAEMVKFREGRQFPEAYMEYMKKIGEDHFPYLDGPVNSTVTEWSEAEATEIIGDRARELGADLVGIALVEDDSVFRGQDIPLRYAVSLGMKMDYDELASGGDKAGVEAFRVYYELGEVTVRLAEYVRSAGHPAKAHHPLGGGEALHVPFAVRSGLGILGRSGVLVTETFGSCLRLGTVSTDLSLSVDVPGNGIPGEFCDTCGLCRDSCPGGAIADEKTEVGGILKYKIDYRKCLPSFSRGCAVCLTSCCFSKKAHGRE